MVVISINITKLCFERRFWEPSTVAGLASILFLIISYISSFVYTFREALRAAKVAISTLICF